MSAEDRAVENGEEVNEFELIENFVASILPNNGIVGEAEAATIQGASAYDRQAMRSNLILSMANLIEMVTYLDNPDEEIEPDTIASIDILTMEVFAEMVRLAFVLNGADPKLFVARVLSAFDWNENNPPASPDNTAVRYLEESLAYFIQEDEDDVKTFLRSLQVLNHNRPDIVAIKWIGGQMFNREGGECLYYNDFVELVVVPYEQKAGEREAARAREAGLDFGQGPDLAPGEEGHHPVQKLFVEQLDELLSSGREIGEQVENKLAGLGNDGPVISVIAREPTMEEAAQGYSPTLDLSSIEARGHAEVQRAIASAGVHPDFTPIVGDPEAEAARLLRVRARISDTSGVDSMYPDKATCERLGLPMELAVDIKPLPGVTEDGILTNPDVLPHLGMKPFEFEGNRRPAADNLHGTDEYTQIPPSLLKKTEE
jgi:hypothetical protein